MQEKVFTEKSEKVWNSLFTSVFIINILCQMGIFTMGTLTAKYANSLGASSEIVGIVASAFAYTALFFKMVSAPAIDSMNRKFILIGALGVMLLAYILYAASGSIPMLIVARLTQGIGQAFTATCCLTIASDSLPLNKMSSGVGIFALGNALAQAIAPTVGLALVGIIGYNKTFLVLAGIMIIAIIYASTMKIDFKKTKKFKMTLSSMIAKEAILPACMIFLLAMVYCNINAFLVLYSESIGIKGNIGLFFTVYAITLLFTRPFVGKMADKFGTVKVVIPGMVLFAVAFFLISFSTNLPMLLTAAAISAFGYGGCTPAIQAIAMKSVPKERRGAASSTSYIGMDLGQFGSIGAGIIVSHFGYAAMWRFMTIPIFIAIFVTVLFRNRISQAGENLDKAV